MIVHVGSLKFSARADHCGVTSWGDPWLSCFRMALCAVWSLGDKWIVFVYYHRLFSKALVVSRCWVVLCCRMSQARRLPWRYANSWDFEIPCIVTMALVSQYLPSVRMVRKHFSDSLLERTQLALLCHMIGSQGSSLYAQSSHFTIECGMPSRSCTLVGFQEPRIPNTKR